MATDNRVPALMKLEARKAVAASLLNSSASRLGSFGYRLSVATCVAVTGGLMCQYHHPEAE
jgi:hypothetical protein